MSITITVSMILVDFLFHLSNFDYNYIGPISYYSNIRLLLFMPFRFHVLINTGFYLLLKQDIAIILSKLVIIVVIILLLLLILFVLYIGGNYHVLMITNDYMYYDSNPPDYHWLVVFLCF